MGVNNLKKSTFNIPQEKNLTSKYFRDSSQPLFHENMSCFYSANIFIIFNRACIQQQNWEGGRGCNAVQSIEFRYGSSWKIFVVASDASLFVVRFSTKHHV